MRHVYFCRHGESVRNVEGIYAGRYDTPLTDHGKEQARLAASTFSDVHFDMIVSSPLSRALDTARIIANGVQYPLEHIAVNPLFIERSWGSLEGQSFDVIPDARIYPDIETEASVASRAQLAYEYLQGLPAESILVVSHGSFAVPFCALFSYATADDELPNAQIVQLA